MFTAEAIGNEHMALLWGNGRMLVGLMGRYAATGDPATLAAARKLADFLLAVRQAAKNPEVAKRLEGQGAFGFICFTQLIEGLDLLGRASGEQRYFEAAKEIVPLLPPRGVQHSHGYLTTLRGALMLYEDTGDPALLAEVEKLWGATVNSGDYIVDGSVLEYFGWSDPANLPMLTSAKEASGAFPRNEGCGLADLIRLTLHLYQVTGNVSYLEQAERCFLNAFAHNQFTTGDFGSRVWFTDGITPTSSVDRAWWCCTMHGYRAYHDVLQSAVNVQKDSITVNLFEELDWQRGASFRMKKTGKGATIDFTDAYPGTLRVRIPKWSSATKIQRSGKPVSVSPGDYVEVGRGFAAGERVTVEFTYRTQLIAAKGADKNGASGNQTQRAAIYSGPYLMVADEELDPYYFSEPWPGNRVLVSKDAAATVNAKGQLRLATRYEHDGFPGTLETTLRPMGEKPARDQRTLAIWLNCKQS